MKLTTVYSQLFSGLDLSGSFVKVPARSEVSLWKMLKENTF